MKCRKCDQDIIWLKTSLGNSMPVNSETVETGDVTFDSKKHVSHFATCPSAEEFRKTKEKIEKPQI